MNIPSQSMVTLKSSREWAPLLSFLASAATMVWRALTIRFCNSRVSTRSVFQIIPLSDNCGKKTINENSNKMFRMILKQHKVNVYLSSNFEARDLFTQQNVAVFSEIVCYVTLWRLLHHTFAFGQNRCCISFFFLWNMIIIVVDCQYTLTSSISLLIAYILSTPSFSAGPSLNTAAWFCIACTTTKIHSLDDHHHSCYFLSCTFKSHNFIGLCFKMSVVPEPLNANSTVNYKYYTIIVKIVIHWWYGLKWYICWFYTFCILCLISAVVWLPLAWRSLSMLATDSSPAFCPKKKPKTWKIRIQ